MFEKKFKLRAPSLLIENTDLPKSKEETAWKEVLKWIQNIDWEKVDSFKFQVNFKKMG